MSMTAEPEVPDIVVVEDDTDDAMITMMALRKVAPLPSFRVIEDGAQALEILVGPGALRPRLVFLDLKMPKVHGLELLRAMKADPDACDIPVVILSSSDEPKDVAAARELGCADYLRKPIDWGQYTTLVCNAASRFLPGSRCE